MLRLNGNSTPSRRNSQYQKRLDTILKAASRVIARDGFEGASMRNLAAKSKIGLSGIYYYFKNKDELLYAIQYHAFATLVESLKEKLQTASGPEQKMKAVFENHFRYFVNNMDEFRVCVHEIDSLSGDYYKRVLNKRQEYFNLVRSAINEVFGKRTYETDLATLFLFGSLNWVYMWYDPKKNADIDKLSTQFYRIFMNGINKS